MVVIGGGSKSKKTARFATGTSGPERVGEPPPPMTKMTYTGEKARDGLPHGHGKAQYANGDVYEGEWKFERRDGVGICWYFSGEVYEGEWKADKREGTGTATYVTGDSYEGDWRFGKREGHGRAQYASRDGYEGQWKADKKQGFGTFWSASGEVYEGQWLTGTYEGRGTYLYASSDVRDFHIQALLSHPDASPRCCLDLSTKVVRRTSVHAMPARASCPPCEQVYEGGYRAGKREGHGVYMYAGGDVYEGEYMAGKMEGRGTYRLADGTAEVGRYFAGSDVGEGARWSADRKTAYRLRGGKVEEEISLEEAARIAQTLGLAAPSIVEEERDQADDTPITPAVDTSNTIEGVDPVDLGAA
jgi:hypothetical protein